MGSIKAGYIGQHDDSDQPTTKVFIGGVEDTQLDPSTIVVELPFARCISTTLNVDDRVKVLLNDSEGAYVSTGRIKHVIQPSNNIGDCNYLFQGFDRSGFTIELVLTAERFIPVT